MMRALAAIVLGLWMASASADLFRWRDPESGSIKYANSPPPWYGNPLLEAKSPKVEVIPSGTNPALPATLAPPPPPAPPSAVRVTIDALEARFKQLMESFQAFPEKGDFERAGSGLRQQVESYEVVAKELDRLDPAGAARRRSQAEPILQRVAEGLKAQISPTPPIAPSGPR